jgi:hypothetical protein
LAWLRQAWLADAFWPKRNKDKASKAKSRFVSAILKDGGSAKKNGNAPVSFLMLPGALL